MPSKHQLLRKLLPKHEAALDLYIQGKTALEVSKIVGVSDETVRAWVKSDLAKQYMAEQCSIARERALRVLEDSAVDAALCLRSAVQGHPVYSPQVRAACAILERIDPTRNQRPTLVLSGPSSEMSPEEALTTLRSLPESVRKAIFARPPEA